jgi:hypothetical protein
MLDLNLAAPATANIALRATVANVARHRHAFGRRMGARRKLRQPLAAASRRRRRRRSVGDFRVGDVVYTIDYEGEGFVSLWRRGETLSWYDQGGEGASGGIQWETSDPAQRATDQARGVGFWLQVQRDNGQTGWVNAETVECLGSMDPTDACRARNGG